MNDYDNINEIDKANSSLYDEKYGNYVQNDLIPQLSVLSAIKMTSSGPVGFFVNTGDEEKDKKIQERIDDIFEDIDLNSVVYTLEERLSVVGNGVVMFEKLNNDKFNVFVPTTTITRVDPSSGELLNLTIIRYKYGGDLIDVCTETYTKTEILKKEYQFDNQKEADELFNSFQKGDIIDEKLYNRKEMKYINELEFIPAVYFENIPTIDKKGRSDFNLNSRYVELLNKTVSRFFWELQFNKSKFIEEQEMGTNLFSDVARSEMNRQMVVNDFVRRQNSLSFIGGNVGSGYQYFETTNQNLLNLIQFFNFFLKKFWEQTGQHQSGSDMGKQVSDLQAEMERGSEVLRFNNKIIRRQKVWIDFLWKMFLSMTDGEYGNINERPKNFRKKNLIFDIKYSKVELEKTIIENEIMKLQSNLTDRVGAIKRVSNLSYGTDINKVAESYLKNNKDDILAQQIDGEINFKGDKLENIPIQVQSPKISNPQGSTNNQSLKFNQQVQDKEKKDTQNNKGDK